MIKILFFLILKKFIINLFIKDIFIINSNYLLLLTYLIIKYINKINIKLILIIGYIIDLLFNNFLGLNTLLLCIIFLIFNEKILNFKYLYKINKLIFLLKFSFILQIIKLFMYFILDMHPIIDLNFIYKNLIYTIFNSLYILVLI